MTNPKIEKVDAAIARTKAVIADYQKKLRDLERQKTDLEDQEIIALYRREKFNQDEFSALLRTQRKTETAVRQSGLHSERPSAAYEKKEETHDANTEN
jgi:septal ring factor EnvC (AmiA/AmiB activator)